jgi:p21-activated kinase 1
VVIEMAQGEAPYMECQPLRALFLLISEGIPDLKEPDKWSPEFKGFLRLATTEDPNQRPDCRALLAHPFLRKACTPAHLASARARAIKVKNADVY